MKKMIALFTLASIIAQAQTNESFSIFDGRSWGVVMQHPDVKNVVLKPDVVYLSDVKGTLKMDVYLPPGIKKNEQRPAVVFLNTIGDRPGDPKIKSWGIYKTWPQLMAAHGYVGISMECDGTRIQESLKGIFSFIAKSGADNNIDANKLGVYAASAQVTQAVVYIMGNEVHSGIKAAVLYYGGAPQGPFRKDLPVYFVIAEGDVARNNYGGLWTEVMKNNAPWTIQMGTNLIHAFDAFNDNDDSRKVIQETISFWKNHLDPIPTMSWPNSIGREVLAAQYGGNQAKAIELFEKWLKDHPDDKEALFQYASTLKNASRFEESEVAYRKVLKQEPDNVHALTYMYLVLHNLGRPAEAEPFLLQAEKTGRIDKFIYMGMGYSMYSLNKHKEGVKFFEKVVEFDPSGFNLYNLACGYARIDDREKAFATLQKSIDNGFTSKQQFENDTDLTSLKSDPRFSQLLLQLK